MNIATKHARKTLNKIGNFSVCENGASASGKVRSELMVIRN